MLRFNSEGHKYESLNPVDAVDWISVTTLVKQFVEPFDALTMSIKCSGNKKSKWYGIPPEEIRSIWSGEADRSTGLGTWFHKKEESDLLSQDLIEKFGIMLPVVKPVEIDGWKVAPEQKLVDGVYPEHFMYLRTEGVCGQTDRADVVKAHIYIDDYKTNKEVTMEGFRSWNGTKKMLAPLSHLDDCDYTKFCLQLSTYAYIIKRHNPQLAVGRLNIRHIVFEVSGTDKYGYPITALDERGDPIVKDIVPITLRYLEPEVKLMLSWLEQNRDKIRTKN